MIEKINPNSVQSRGVVNLTEPLFAAMSRHANDGILAGNCHNGFNPSQPYRVMDPQVERMLAPMQTLLKPVLDSHQVRDASVEAGMKLRMEPKSPV